MYNDAIKVANKIISYEDLSEIFSMMNEKLVYYQKIHQTEEMQNKMLEYNYQRWTFKDCSSSLTFYVNFYDNTDIKFDNYNNFLTVFNNRVEEIKSIDVRFSLNYEVYSPEVKRQYYIQRINMRIYEQKMEIELSLSSEDRKIDDVYEFIKSKLLNAPEKYDMIIKKKNSINMTVGLAIGLIPALGISIFLLFIPIMRQLFASTFVLFPICCFVLAFLIGGTIGSAKLSSFYKTITPEKKYEGYDSNKGKSIYKDDIDKYVDTSEILIGKNIDNLRFRAQIKACYETYKKYVPYELGIVLVLSIIVLFIG